MDKCQIRKIIAEELAAFVEIAAIPLAELADKANIPEARLRSLLDGNESATLEEFVLLLKAMQIEPQYLLFRPLYDEQIQQYEYRYKMARIAFKTMAENAAHPNYQKRIDTLATLLKNGFETGFDKHA